MRQIRWPKNTVVKQEVISQIELIWKIKLPLSYKQIVQIHDGSDIEVEDTNNEWKSGIIQIKNYGRSDLYLLSIDKEPLTSESRIESAYQSYQDSLPDRVYPFAENSGGDLFLFDYQFNTEPSIVFLQHDRLVSKNDLDDIDLSTKPLEEWLSKNLIFVSNSFDDLLKLIYPIDS